MKKRLFIILSVGFLCSFIIGCANNVSDDKKEPEKKTVTTYDKTDGHKIITDYLDDKKIKESHYDDKEIISYSYEYYINNNNTKYTVYNSDGKILFYCFYELDSDHYMKKYIKYDANDTVLFKYAAPSKGFINVFTNPDESLNHINVFDENTNKIKEVYYNPDGTVLFYSIIDFNSNKQRVKFTRYDADDSILIEYIADDGNNIWINELSDGTIDVIDEWENSYIRRTAFYLNGKLTNINEYDDDHKLIKCRRYDSDGKLDNISEYDESGNQKKYTKYNLDGSICFINEAKPGNHLSITNNNGTYSVEEYDTQKKCVKKTLYDSTGKIFYSEDY